ncbi:MAG: hypothetical protein NTV79_08600, partial [Candidatus Aureabacteria bacterium]|nr:hypothetical protein [Candidatus Auribacterota bacterium]
NNCSIVARLAYRDFSVLLTGDAEEPAEKEILSRGGPLKSTILKVAHHGSRSSTSARFLSAVSPRLAVISVGPGNSYNLPRPEILRRLESAGAEILRTDESGAIVVSTDGRDRRVEFPGKASYPDYEIPPDRAGQIVAPKEQEYFSTEDAAQRAGYVKSWY